MPAILWGPSVGIPAGRKYGQPSVAMDIAPTLLKLAGSTTGMPGQIDGVDLGPAVLKGAPNPHENIFWKYLHHRAVVHQGRWKLKAERADAKSPLLKIQLFDLAGDLAETTDRASAEPKLVTELSELLNRWEARTLS